MPVRQNGCSVRPIDVTHEETLAHSQELRARLCQRVEQKLEYIRELANDGWERKNIRWDAGVAQQFIWVIHMDSFCRVEKIRIFMFLMVL